MNNDNVVTKIWNTELDLFSFVFQFDYTRSEPVQVSVTIQSGKGHHGSPPLSPPLSPPETPQTFKFSSGIPSRSTMIKFDLQAQDGTPIKGTMTLVGLNLPHTSDNAGVWIDTEYGENLVYHSEGVFVTYQIFQ